MTKPGQDNIDVEYLLKYLRELEVDFANLHFDEFSPEQAGILSTLPHEVKKHIEQVKKIIEEQKEIEPELIENGQLDDQQPQNDEDDQDFDIDELLMQAHDESSSDGSYDENKSKYVR